MLKLITAKFSRWTRSSFPLSFFVLLGCLGLIAVCGWLSQEVLEKEVFGFDTTILLWLHQHSNSSIDNVMLRLTSLGDPEFVVVIVTISFSLLLWKKRVWAAQILVLTCLGGLILNQGLKLVFAKPSGQV